MQIAGKVGTTLGATPAGVAAGAGASTPMSATLQADLTCTEGPMIAGQAATWGSASTVEDKRAVSKNNGICEFRIDYTVHNLGNAPMMPTSSTFRTLFTNSAVSGN